MHKRTAWFMMAVSFLGFIDASYLTAKHYMGTALTCALFEGCDVVTTSKYSEVLGVPVSLVGSVYYLSVFIFVAYYLDSQKLRSLALAAYASMAGFAASLGFIYIQVFVLKALCIYCLFSALTSTLLFIAGVSMLMRSKKMRDQ